MSGTESSAVDLHRRAAHQFGKAVEKVRDGQWTRPTPCEEWDVRALVNHVVSEARWTPPMLAGLSIDEVGDTLSGDLLGVDPIGAWMTAQKAACEAADEPGVSERIVRLSFGDTAADEYLRQLTADYLVHGWDLATAIGVDSDLDPDLVSAVTAWFVAEEPHYRAAGAIAARVAVGDNADPQTALLAMFGR